MCAIMRLMIDWKLVLVHESGHHSSFSINNSADNCLLSIVLYYYFSKLQIVQNEIKNVYKIKRNKGSK